MNKEARLIKKLLTPEYKMKTFRVGWWWKKEFPYLTKGLSSFLPVDSYGKHVKKYKGEIGRMFGRRIIVK